MRKRIYISVIEMIKKVVREKKIVSIKLMCLYCKVKNCRRRKIYEKSCKREECEELRNKKSWKFYCKKECERRERIYILYCCDFEKIDERIVFYDDVSECEICRRLVEELSKDKY